jgi:hypothetical protein
MGSDPVSSRIRTIRGCLLLIRLSSDDLQELIHWAGLPVDRYMLCDVKLQALDVLLESSHVRVRSRCHCALSGR